MLTTIKGIYTNGQVLLQEPAPTTEEVEVLVTFTTKVPPAANPVKKPVFGFAKGTVLYMATDFDAPLDDFKDYM